MTSLPSHLDLTAARDAADWIALAEAARLLGHSERHVRRQCATWQQQGLAEKRVEGWMVKREVDLRLKLGPRMAGGASIDLASQYPKAKIEQARQRVECVKRFRALISTSDSTEKLDLLIDSLANDFPGAAPGSARTLYRWHRKCSKHLDITDVQKMIKKAGGRNREVSEEAWAYFESLFLDPNQPTLRKCWRLTKEKANEEGWRWCTESTCRDQINQRIPVVTQIKHRDPWKYEQECLPHLLVDGNEPDLWEPGTLWIGDHTQLDMWCRTATGQPIRPWLTAWMDWRSRRVVGWCLSDSPNSTTILAAFRAGMLDEANRGGPDEVWIDNGKDYASAYFCGQTKQERRKAIKEEVAVDEQEAGGLFGALGIKPRFAIPYRARSKGRLERWFGTFHGEHDEQYPSFCGSKPELRPERCDKLLARFRKGETNVLPEYRAVELTVRDMIDIYNATWAHSGAGMDGRTPDQVMSEARIKAFGRSDVLDYMLAMWPQPQHVSAQLGVSIAIGGTTYWYGQHNTALTPYKVTRRSTRKAERNVPQVRVSYDPNDLSKVWVWTMDHRLITTARANDVMMRSGTPVADKHVRQVNRDQAATRKAEKQLAKTGLNKFRSPGELAKRVASEQRAAEAQHDLGPRPRPRELAHEDGASDATLKLARTPLDEAVNSIEKEQVKQAAGAESDAAPSKPKKRLSLTAFSGGSLDLTGGATSGGGR